MTGLPNVVIFCKVIDNFGDIGVCLRLALGLIDRGCPVTLVTDRPDLAARMDPAAEVKVLSWDTVAADPHSARLIEDILIVEAFQVTPPRSFLQACAGKQRRICLDYFATEAWAESLQALPAPDPAFPGHSRIWLAPSFSASGPGFIRGRWEEIEPETRMAMRQRLIAYGAHEVAFGDRSVMGNRVAKGNRVAMGNSHTYREAGTPTADRIDARRVLLVLTFGYDDAPWAALAQVMQQEGLPEGRASGGTLPRGALPHGFDRVCFVKPSGLDFSQREFDAVLQSCDLNFVRGEDSFVRAHFAAAGRWGVPFIWQPYRQAAGAHLDKLTAWQQHLVHAHDLRSGLEPKALASSDAVTAVATEVWQSWLAMQAFFSPPVAGEPAAVPPFTRPPSSTRPPSPPANLDSLKQLSLSWQTLQQNWDVFRNAFSLACQQLIPGQSLEKTLVDLNDDWP